MGLIKAGLGAVGGTLADQWKEFFYCESLDKDVLMTKVKKELVTVHPTPKEMITLFRTVQASLLPMGNV